MKWIGVTLVTVFLLVQTGCAIYRAPFRPPPGLAFSLIKAPLTTEFDQTPVGTKQGKSTSLFLLVPFTYGLLSFAWDDCGIEDAALKGNLKQVYYADYEFVQMLGLFARTTVTVYGE